MSRWSTPDALAVVRTGPALRLPFPAGDAGHDERDEGDGGGEGAGPLRGDAGQGEYVLDHVQQQDAGEGTERGAAPAVEADAADHRRREHGEDVPVALCGRDGREPA